MPGESTPFEFKGDDLVIKLNKKSIKKTGTEDAPGKHFAVASSHGFQYVKIGEHTYGISFNVIRLAPKN